MMIIMGCWLFMDRTFGIYIERGQTMIYISFLDCFQYLLSFVFFPLIRIQNEEKFPRGRLAWHTQNIGRIDIEALKGLWYDAWISKVILCERNSSLQRNGHYTKTKRRKVYQFHCIQYTYTVGKKEGRFFLKHRSKVKYVKR